MATANSVMALIRAYRPSFRNPHDKIAFALNASFLAAGYVLTATGNRAFSDAASSLEEEVGIDGWNALDDCYGFIYKKVEKGTKKSIMVKCSVKGKNLVVDAMCHGEEQKKPVYLQINVNYWVSDDGGKSTNYAEIYKNLPSLIDRLQSCILDKLENTPKRESASTSRLKMKETSEVSQHDKKEPSLGLLTEFQRYSSGIIPYTRNSARNRTEPPLPPPPLMFDPVQMGLMFTQMAHSLDARRPAPRAPAPTVNDAVDQLFCGLRNHPMEKFDGIAAVNQPILAERWLAAIEKALKLIRCSEGDKVMVGTSLLTREAQQWWEAEARMLLREGPVLTWGQFKTKFNAKYFPTNVKRQLENEFTNLQQGNMTVAQYEARFNELSRFAPDLVSTDDRRARRFENGLRPFLLDRIATLELPTYAQVVHKAKLHERTSNLLFQSRATTHKNDEPQSKKQKVQNLEDNETLNQAGKTNPKCTHCGKFHPGTCYRLLGACFNCGEQGHKFFECTKLNKQNTNPQQPRNNNAGNGNQNQQGLVFATTQQEAETYDVTRGIEVEEASDY